MIKTQFVHQAELGLDPFIEEYSPRRFHEIAIGQAAIVGINHVNEEVIDVEIEAGPMGISSRRSKDREAEGVSWRVVLEDAQTNWRLKNRDAHKFV